MADAVAEPSNASQSYSAYGEPFALSSFCVESAAADGVAESQGTPSALENEEAWTDMWENPEVAWNNPVPTEWVEPEQAFAEYLAPVICE